MRRFLFTLTIVAMAACNKERTTLPVTPTVPKHLYASFEQPDTRLYIDTELHLHWHAGDAISFFALTADNLRYTFDGATGDVNGTFTKADDGTNDGATLDRNYAIYPYVATTSLTADGTASLTTATTQEYAETSFGREANVMMAMTTLTTGHNLSFKNCGGYLKLQLYGEDVTVSSIKLEGNLAEPLAGSATLVMNTMGLPTMTMNSTAATALTLDCGTGVVLSNSDTTPTPFYLVLPPMTFSEGLKITVTDNQGREFVQSTTNRVEIERNTIQPMAALNVLFEDNELPTTMAGTWRLHEWHGTTPDFGVYMDITAEGSITLWQRIDSYEWSTYHSTATLNGDVISGTYSDGYAWSASYSVTLDGDVMTWTNTENSNDVSVYVRTTLPDNLAETRATESNRTMRFL